METQLTFELKTFRPEKGEKAKKKIDDALESKLIIYSRTL